MLTVGEKTEVEREDNLNDHGYQVREVFAQFGLAMYKAQVLEQALVNVLTYAQASKASYPSPEIFEAFLDDNLTVTMGRILRRLEPYLENDQLFGRELSDALTLRNRLAHSYFREHDHDFFSFTGRETMLAEVIAAQEQFASLDKRLEPVLHRFLESAGVSPDFLSSFLKANLESITEAAKRRDSE